MVVVNIPGQNHPHFAVSNDMLGETVDTFSVLMKLETLTLIFSLTLFPLSNMIQTV